MPDGILDIFLSFYSSVRVNSKNGCGKRTFLQSWSINGILFTSAVVCSAVISLFAMAKISFSKWFAIMT